MSYQDLLYPDTWYDQFKSVIFVSGIYIYLCMCMHTQVHTTYLKHTYVLNFLSTKTKLSLIMAVNTLSDNSFDFT